MAAITEILSPGSATPVDDVRDDDELSVADLVRMFEESEDATNDARKESERDRDYVDNKQLTSEQLSALAKRGQPPMIDNRIKSKVDYLVGLEKQQRIDPRALPRTPQHEQDAQGATQALRYVAEEQDYDNKRSAVWRNLLVEGAGGYSIPVEVKEGAGYGGRSKVTIRIDRVPWDRMFWDPHSSESDFSDAGYLGIVLWMDIADAKLRWSDADAQEALDTTMQSAPSDTYDDKPKFNHWADKKRKRVRICQIWVKRDNDWHFAEFTKGGILKAGPSPHVTDQGESDCELLFQSAYVDRDNNRYGLVREMITLQDGINKRGSKLLHLANTKQVWLDEDALPSSGIEKLRKEAARPDGTIVLNPGSMQHGKIKVETHLDVATTQFQLLQDAKNSIDLKGPNATSMGDKAQGSAAASGRAIIASQQGGMVSLGDLLDSLRHLDKRAFRTIWSRIRQYWNEEIWIRVTDDERNIKWVGMNVDPQQVQLAAQQNPEMAAKIGGVVGSVAELDCDIIIDEAPDSVVPALEQFEALVQLKQYDVNNELPFRALVQAAPNLKDKDKVFKEMDEAEQKRQNPQAQQIQQIQTAGAVAEVKETESRALLNIAKAHEAGQPEPGAAPQQQDFEIPPQIQVAKAVADIGLVHANTDKVRTDTALAPAKASHDAKMKQDALAQRSQMMKQRPQSAA
jgi:hypothetical protein